MGKNTKNIQINDSKLYDKIVEYCKLNSLKISDFITEMVRKQFMIEKYGDTPFMTYETTIIDNNPVSSLTMNVIIEKPNEDESIKIVKNVKTNDEIIHPSIVSVPYTIEENGTLVTNGDSNLNKRFLEKKVPLDFYGEINVEPESKKQKPKKRRL